MSKLLQKVQSKKRKFAALLFLLCFYIFTRLVSLDLFPIFTDEAIYVRWSQIASFDPAWRFISLTDGKQPLLIWLGMISVRFIQDPLIAVRLVSVLAGFGTTIGLYLLGRELFQDHKTGLVTAMLYLLYPFALVYDRMALMDSLVGMFSVWSLYLQVLLIKKPRLDIALLLGMVMGGGVLTKSTGFLSIYLLPLSLLLYFGLRKKQKRHLLKWFGLALLAIVLTQVIYALLRLSPFYHMIGQKNNVFLFSFSEWREQPFRFFYGNLKGLWDWFSSYFGWVMMVPLLLGLLKFWQRPTIKILLVSWFVIPLFGLANFGKVLYPRFIFFMTLPLLVLAAGQIVDFFRRGRFVWWLSFLLFLPWLRTDWLLLTDPYRAPIAGPDLGQYLNDWPAGGGIEPAVSFLSEEAEKGPVLVYTEGTFGLLPYGLEIYLQNFPQIQIKGIWPLPEQLPDEILAEGEEKKVYFVLNQTQEAPTAWPVVEISRFQKGLSDKTLTIYEVTGQNES